LSEPVEAFKNAFRIPELKSRIIFTMVMLAVYRLGAHVPSPGVDGQAIAMKMGDTGGLMNFYDMFTGGAFQNATIFALGIMPYITASIIFSLLIPVIPALEALQKSGSEGQKKITEWTRYATIILCAVQSIGYAVYLQNMGKEIVPNPGVWFILMCVITFTTGTAFIMWLGEQISEHGIGNGISMIIFTSIVSDMPNSIFNLLSLIRNGQVNRFQALLLVLAMVIVVMGAIIVTTGQRRIPVQYPRQMKGRGVTGHHRNYLPLRVNQAGVIPIIFASSILMLPGMFLSAVDIPTLQPFIDQITRPDAITHNIIFVVLIIFFSFFYTAITFNPVETADNMKKYGGVIIGVRPGKATALYLEKVMTRITLVGSLFLAGVAIVPVLVITLVGVQDWGIARFFGGTSLLIVVGVALDTLRQIEQHLTMRHYEGFGGGSGGRVRSRR
jgi:preprotein translocase subunit SecY